jgi:hypothetical protein
MISTACLIAIARGKRWPENWICLIRFDLTVCVFHHIQYSSSEIDCKLICFNYGQYLWSFNCRNTKIVFMVPIESSIYISLTESVNYMVLADGRLHLGVGPGKRSPGFIDSILCKTFLCYGESSRTWYIGIVCLRRLGKLPPMRCLFNLQFYLWTKEVCWRFLISNFGTSTDARAKNTCNTNLETSNVHQVDV